MEMRILQQIPIHHSFGLGSFAGFPEIFLALIILGISLALIFAGRKLIKALAFLVAGGVLGAIGASLGIFYLGPLGALLGGVLGFVVGGLLGVMVVRLGIGLALGYVGYSISLSLIGNVVISLIAGLIMFFIGLFISNKILSLVSVILGGMLLFDVLISIGSGVPVGLVVAVLISAIGLWFQNRTTRTYARTAPAGNPTVHS